ncbi:MAG: CdvA-like protein [Candidatus Bathyarchaeota archaeon]|nr:MAG: CdvA-like protein [Candidatus Bathyarchaeota archaeon]
MSKPISNPFLFVGNQIKDEYGRQIGRIASFKIAPTGRIDGVFVEHGDGEFLSYSSDQIKMDNGTLVVSPSIKLSANSICQEIPLIWRKDKALNDLVAKKKIPAEMYDDLHSTFEGALNELNEKATDLIGEIDNEIDRCNTQIHELHSALINLEIEREIGRLTAESYDKALRIIQWGLKGANAEKQDLELVKSKLDNLLIGEKTKSTPSEELQLNTHEPTETSNPQPSADIAHNLPEPPVIIHVRNPNKQTS